MAIGAGHSLGAVLDACVRRGVRVASPRQEHDADIGVQRTAQAPRGRSLKIGSGPVSPSSAWSKAVDGTHRMVEESALDTESVALTSGGIDGLGKDASGARWRILEGAQAILPAVHAAGALLAIDALHPMYAADRNAIRRPPSPAP
ncbi:hypothetical protein [Pseudorhodoferax sp.]|uniref:hypothetical protein n=1 Tax=Pseudorhodoferax sp. TaxID=1993553 RepID=UPI0039E66CA3